MSDLLERVLDAHGGLESWSEVTGLTAQLSLGGAFRVHLHGPDDTANRDLAPITLDVTGVAVTR